jgi:broad specificity phosphatase PhoE
MTKVQLILFRHAESTKHKTKKINNVSAGIKNYQTVINSAMKAQLPHPDLVYCSPYQRALETAEVFSEAIGYPANKIVQDWRISEYEEHHENPFLPEGSPENNLSDTDRFHFVVERVKSFIGDIGTTDTPRTIYLFSHGIIINYINQLCKGNKIASRGKNVPYVTPYVVSIDV